MRLIKVVKGNSKGKFRVLVNNIQEGCELSTPVLANFQATKLIQIYRDATLQLFGESIQTEKTEKI